MPGVPPSAPTGDDLLKVLSALGNPHRMRIVAALLERRNYVSELARLIGMGRPLLHMHLQRLEAAGLVVGTLEVGEDGKSMKYYDVTPFLYQLTPRTVAEAAATLTRTTDPDPAAGRTAKEEAK
ncbi:ArsR/SmtB family transcription factor [Streptomyces parvulus]|uniref:Winged helix-turn-helix domain-containing protein n=1 Tax=Streptomyces parvulus TaxID=146923 RepID=A0ABV5DIK5_9ACTN